jgi:lysozyme
MNKTQFVINLIKKHEGKSLKPYKDTEGKLTIGYGRNLDDVGISEVEAQEMLLTDALAAERAAVRLFKVYPELSITRQAVLINMMYNLGYNKLSGFKKMIAAVESKDYSKAASEMLNSKWAKQVGARAVELAEMMRGGESNVAS